MALTAPDRRLRRTVINKYFIYALTEAAKLRAADECEKIAELTPANLKKLAKNGSDRG